MRCARFNVGGDDRRRNREIFNAAGTKPFAHKLAYAIVLSRLRVRLPKAKEVTNAYGASQVAEFAYGNPIGKRSAQKASNAGADDPCDVNMFLFQDLKYP